MSSAQSLDPAVVNSEPAKSALLHIEVALPKVDVARLESELKAVRGSQQGREEVCSRHHHQMIELIKASPALPLLHESIVLPSEEDVKACIATAQRYKALGNTLFGKHQYADATRHYSRALLLSTSSPSLTAMCLTNRAACMFHLARWDACLGDCIEAVEIDPTYEKAWARIAEARAKRGEWKEVLEAAAKVAVQTEALKKVAEEGTAKLTASDAASSAPAQPITYPSVRLPSYTTIPSSSLHPQLAHASSSIEKVQSEEKGRFVRAKEEVQVGETIMSEPAYAAVLRNTLRPKIPVAAKLTAADTPPIEIEESRCEWCFNRFQLAPLPNAPSSSKDAAPLSFYTCRRCPALYCSPACREASAEEHALECGLQRVLQLLPEVTRLAMRMAVKGGKEKAAQSQQESNSNVWKADARDVDSLLSHLHEMPASALVEYEFQAAVSEYIYQHLHSHHPHEGHLHLQYPQLLHHLCQTRTNIYAITTLQHSIVTSETASSQVVSTAEQVRLALGVFPTGALMNHSCTPNISLKYHGRHLTVRAIESIRGGEEVRNCYGPDRARMKRNGRRRILMEEYLFDCACTACSDQTKGGAQHDFDEFRCTKCGCPGALVEVLDADVDTPPVCDTCGETCATFAELKAQQAILECDLLAARDAVDSNDLGTAFGLGTELLAKQRALFVPQHSHLSQTLDLLAECCAHGEKFHEATVYLRQAIQIVEGMFGSGSVEVGHELCKLAQLYFHAQQPEEALAVISRALPLLQLYEDDASEEVVDLMRMKVELELMRDEKKANGGKGKKAIKG